jgi:outer membrane protein assembly factor BamB
VLTAPTYAKGRLVFGARDGCVYAVDAKTGELAWKFMAAPEQRYLLAYGQMESVWPVHGCLPVVDGTVIATAGYHAEADGGIWAWGLNLDTGDIAWTRRLERMERPWQSFTPVKGGILGGIGTAEHELAQNDKNGGYRPTRVRNIDLPMYDDEVAFVANIPLRVADGAVVERGVRDALVIHGERFPFLDMEFERRSGPHGSGGIGVVLGGTKILGFRSGRRAIHNDKQALVAPSAGGYHVGPELYLLNATNLGKSEPKGREPIATAAKNVGAGADSLVAGGATAFVAGEGNLTRPWGHDGKQVRPRPRWYKGEPIPGHIEAFSLPDGERLAHIQVDSAVINNGLAVADGRLYAVCEDGTVRCYE